MAYLVHEMQEVWDYQLLYVFFRMHYIWSTTIVVQEMNLAILVCFNDFNDLRS